VASLPTSGEDVADASAAKEDVDTGITVLPSPSTIVEDPRMTDTGRVSKLSVYVGTGAIVLPSPSTMEEDPNITETGSVEKVAVYWLV
jgi:hypothetical protein